MRHKISYMLVAVIMVLTLVAPTMAAFPPPPDETVTIAAPPKAKDATGATVYIIQFEEPALPAYKGGVTGLRATSPSATGETKLNANSPDSVAYRDYLAASQAQFIIAMDAALDRSVQVLFQYQVALNGMAVEMTAEEAVAIAEFPGVKSVIPDWEEYAQTDVGPEWIGAGSIWDGSATGVPTKGEGIVVGVLDTGINMDHPSFAVVGGDAYTNTNPRGKFYGWCDPASAQYTTTVTCNDKLIGVWSGDDDSPEDANGHGTHTASTAAGNVVLSTTAVLSAPTTAFSITISGVAPHANIIAYNIEGTPGEGSASGAVIIAATEQAILDDVDVINYSFGGGGADPWASAMHWLNVRDAGIFAATSAGNAGPDAGTIGSPANAPWITTVGASTHNRKFVNSLINMVASGPADIEGKSITSGYGPAQIVHAGWYSNTIITPTTGYDAFDTARMCLQEFPTGIFSGEIVVCDRGVIARTGKGDNVLAGGAGGYVLANAEANGNSLNADAHSLPAVHISYSDGVTLSTWMTNTTVQTATIAGSTMDINNAHGDIMASFSSRGENTPLPDVIKPDVTAPGVDIVAASMDGIEYESMGGTSMSSPHVAGAGALIRALHPTWSPAEIQAALMSTALTASMKKEDGTTPADLFDMGGGRIDVSVAAQAGLVLDETTANFEAANPTTGGDPTTLNLASLGDAHCIETSVWTRVLSSTLGVAETWTVATTNPTSVTLTVDPISFTLAAGATQVVTVTADASALPLDQWAFGEVKFTPATTATVDAHFPVAVQRVFANVPDLVVIATDQYTDTETVQGLEGPEITALTINEYGLTQATLNEEYLNEDPTPDTISLSHNPDEGIMVLTTVVTDTDKRLVAEVITTTSPDLDMYIYLPGTGFMCISATGATLEYCSVEDPAAGTYYIIVQNWMGSAAQPDRVVLATALVPGTDAGNMTVTGPITVPVGTSFDVDIAWDVSEGKPNTLGVDNYWYGAFDLGTDASNPGNMGLVSTNLVHTGVLLFDYYLPIVMRNS